MSRINLDSIILDMDLVKTILGLLEENMSLGYDRPMLVFLATL